MSNPEQIPQQPELLDPRDFRTMARLYSAVANSPLSRIPDIDEANMWPGAELYPGEDGNPNVNFEVGKLRDLFIHSGTITARAQLTFWNERLVEVHKLPEDHHVRRRIAKMGFPLAFIYLTTEPNEVKPGLAAEEPWDGQLTGFLELYQKNIVTTDFNYGTGPAEDPTRQAHLLKIVNFLGLNPELVIDVEFQDNYENFDNRDLTRFTDGLRNILQANSNDIVL